MENQLVTYLKTRRSMPAAQLRDPGPDDETLRSILEIAARVPDHGKLAPWRFILYDRACRQSLLDGLLRRAAGSADETERRVRGEKVRGLLDAPLIIGVVSSPMLEHPKIPIWEQQLSSGAVCLNLLHAANAYGFAAQWLTGWYAYDDDARRWLGMKEGERLAGFIHIGTPTMPPTERERPDLARITTRWTAAESGDGGEGA